MAEQAEDLARKAVFLPVRNIRILSDAPSLAGVTTKGAESLPSQKLPHLKRNVPAIKEKKNRKKDKKKKIQTAHVYKLGVRGGARRKVKGYKFENGQAVQGLDFSSF